MSSGEPTARRAWLTDLAVVVTVKALVGALVLAGGFRAVSDDDFARVVIAERFAAEPALDPTGTSWLPAPFWLYGAVMRIIGANLSVARVTAFALGLGSAALVYAAARLLIDDHRDARLGAVVAALLPWSARLGVATVPELPTAALATFAIATLARTSGRARLAGGAALFIATLSRYDAWPVAAAFGAITLWDLWRRRASQPLSQLGGGVLAGMGPALWLAHNAVAHGSALHFASRVGAYWDALGREAVPPLVGYPLALLREEPELCLLAASLWVARSIRGDAIPPTLARSAGICLWMLLALGLAALPGAAPTHHAGRALLTVWLVASIYVGAALRRALTTPSLQQRAAALVLSQLVVGTLVLRPWFSRLDSFTPRHDEVAIGRAVAASVPAGERVLLEVVDYRFHAVLAASGRPGDFVLERSIDPRAPRERSSFSSEQALMDRVAASRVRYVVGRATGASAFLGEPIGRRGAWRLWRW